MCLRRFLFWESDSCHRSEGEEKGNGSLDQESRSRFTFKVLDRLILFLILLREYAMLTGSMADSARQIRYPLLVRDDGLLQRGLEKQARLILDLPSFIML